MLALLLLSLTVLISPQPLLEPGHSRQLETEEGSACLYEDGGNYFDYIEVDDEDYVIVEEGSAESEESVRRGPPVFTDYIEDSLLKMSDNGDEESKASIKDSYSKNTPPDDMVRKIVPETLVIKNQTHASLNGRLIITNRQSPQEPVLDLFFEDETDHSEEEESDIGIGVNSKSSKIFNSIFTALVCRFIMLL